MKVLTAGQMREVDRQTIEAGIPGLILMENAGSRVVDSLIRVCAPLKSQRVLVVCGKGNNGGDGFVIARQLFTRKLCRDLHVWAVGDTAELKGDAATNHHALEACGCPVHSEPPPDAPTLIVDALLGTGLTGAVKPGPVQDCIGRINNWRSVATVVSVDIASGLPSDLEAADTVGDYVRAHHTVTFVAPKQTQVLPPLYEHSGKLEVVPIGTPRKLVDDNAALTLNLTTPGDLSGLLSPRPMDGNKGLYGHVLVVGGSFGKSGAPAMSGFGAYRSGAGLVTVGIPKSALSTVAALRPELMTEPLEETPTGRLPLSEAGKILELASKMTVVALGPGLGTEEQTVQLARKLYAELEAPAVVDADALNALAGHLPPTGKVRILTPHPGEMGRLVNKSTKEVQSDRFGEAQRLAKTSGAAIVLKGDRTIIAFPDGEIWVNPTGSPSMATGGTGDILTGMIAGLVAQHPKEWKRATVAAVWLHGRCGQLGGERWGEESLLASDLLEVLPAAMNEIRAVV